MEFKSDEIKEFTVHTSAPLSLIRIILVHNKTKSIFYDILKGDRPQVDPGDTLSVMVAAENIGLSGRVWGKIIDEEGRVMGSFEDNRKSGERFPIDVLEFQAPKDTFEFKVEVGHA